MFLVKDRRLGLDNFVFTVQDPRAEGYTGDVVEDVTLDFDMNSFWPDGETRPDPPQLGRDPANAKRYKVFKSPSELRAANYQFEHSNAPFVEYSWSAYRNRYYPVPQEFAARMTSDEWFDFLEDADAAANIRKMRSERSEPQPGSTRDQIAQWVAKQHAGSDGSIRQIWFLPANSPPDEIRLLEINDRYTGESTNTEPVAFALHVAGANFKLAIADVSSAQLEKIKGDPKRSLPKGWEIGNAVSWARRELGQ